MPIDSYQYNRPWWLTESKAELKSGEQIVYQQQKGINIIEVSPLANLSIGKNLYRIDKFIKPLRYKFFIDLFLANMCLQCYAVFFRRKYYHEKVQSAYSSVPCRT